jgi:hypothetical protein
MHEDSRYQLGVLASRNIEYPSWPGAEVRGHQVVGECPGVALTRMEETKATTRNRDRNGDPPGAAGLIPAGVVCSKIGQLAAIRKYKDKLLLSLSLSLSFSFSLILAICCYLRSSPLTSSLVIRNALLFAIAASANALDVNDRTWAWNKNVQWKSSVGHTPWISSTLLNDPSQSSRACPSEEHFEGASRISLINRR